MLIRCKSISWRLHSKCGCWRSEPPLFLSFLFFLNLWPTFWWMKWVPNPFQVRWPGGRWLEAHPGSFTSYLLVFPVFVAISFQMIPENWTTKNLFTFTAFCTQKLRWKIPNNFTQRTTIENTMSFLCYLNTCGLYLVFFSLHTPVSDQSHSKKNTKAEQAAAGI